MPAWLVMVEGIVVAIVTAFKGIIYRPPMANLRPEAPAEAPRHPDENMQAIE